MRVRCLDLMAAGLVSALIVGVLIQPSNAYWTVPSQKQQQAGMLSRFYYQSAMQVAAQGGLALSTDLLEKVYRLNPKSPDIALTYATFLKSQGQMEKALAVYEECLLVYKSPMLQALFLYQQSLTYDTMNNTVHAIAAMEKAIKQYPGDTPAAFYYDIGVLHAKLNRFDEARQYSEKALAKAPQSAAAWNNYGYSLAKLGEYQQGFQAVKKSLELEPNNPNALDSMGYILFRMGQFKESIIEYEKAIKLDPKLADSYLYLGKSYEATLEWGKAIEAYEKYLELSDNHTEKVSVEDKLRQLKDTSWPQDAKKILSF